MRKPCSIEGCDRFSDARGWCNKHYQAWYHHGDPLKTVVPPPFASGKRFGRAVVIELTMSPEGRTDRHYRCRCDCGKEFVTRGNSLSSGHTKSCGCWREEVRAATARTRSLVHGHTVGREESPTHGSWAAMFDRCENPKDAAYYRYGGRGITICDRWREPNGQGFANFLKDMGERPDGRSIDRIDNDGNYEPGNCRWATHSQQMKNRRPRSEWKNASVGRGEPSE